jgi:hypothetical protein
VEKIVGIAFASAPKGDSPNIRGRNEDAAVKHYFQAMACLFASVRRWNSDIRLELITDADPPAFFLTATAKLELCIVKRAFTFRPPPGYADRFNASMFLLDALEVYKDANNDASIALVDPDVLCIKSLGPMFDAAFTVTGAYPMNFSRGDNINGLSRNEAALLHGELDNRAYDAGPHYGGELLVVRSSSLGPLVDRCRRAFLFSIQRSQRGQTKFTTEEHIVSYGLRDQSVADMSPFVRRIWTCRTSRSIRGDEYSLALWHVPAEKGRGFGRLFSYVQDQNSWFWNSGQEEFTMRAASILGIKRTPGRVITDSAARVVRSIRSGNK